MRQKRLGALLTAIAIIMVLTGCHVIGTNAKSRHCYLCGTVPSSKLCLLKLSTGNMIELPLDKDTGHISMVFCGDAYAIGHDDGSCTVRFPLEPQEVVNADLFCDDCLSSIAEVENNGYVLADVQNLENIRLYPISDDSGITIRGYCVSTDADRDTNSLMIKVAD